MPLHDSDDVQNNDNALESSIVIDEQIVLTKDQYELLKIISNTSNKSISEYIQKAVVETMKTEIEFGDFCDRLLDKLDNGRESTDLAT